MDRAREKTNVYKTQRDLDQIIPCNPGKELTWLAPPSRHPASCTVEMEFGSSSHQSVEL